MRTPRRHRASRDAEPVDLQELQRDAEESLVAALQESDTAVEALGDSHADAPAGSRRAPWAIGLAGLTLAAIGLLITRRRR